MEGSILVISDQSNTDQNEDTEPHPASIMRMSRAPVTTDRSPPSCAKAAACADRAPIVPSQSASPLTAIPQPLTLSVNITDARPIHPLARLNIAFKPFPICISASV